MAFCKWLSRHTLHTWALQQKYASTVSPPNGWLQVLLQLPTKLDLQIPKRLSEWLKETHTHEGAEIAAIYAEFFEPMQAKCGGDIDISELKAKMPSDQLDEVITTSGKKSPVQKKLFTRLHFELRYPLNDKQAKKIKVKPHPEEGVP